MNLGILAAAMVFIAFRLWRRRRRITPEGGRGIHAAPPRWSGITGVVALVAAREMRERTRSRVFRIGTAVILLVVAAGIVIPVVRRGRHAEERVGLVGVLSDPLREAVRAAGAAAGVRLTLKAEPSATVAESELRSGRVDLVIVGTTRLVVKRAFSTTTSNAALTARAIAATISLQGGLEAAGLSPQQAAVLAHPPPVPITSLQPAPHNQTARATAVYGLILIFVLLSQYGTWILMGVVEEKSSRVVEVLLAAIRPWELLTGKVLGIGAVALGQGALLVAVALGLAGAVGSDLVRGTAPMEVLTVLCWLVLGYAFYCWVYAAGGALAERQEHVQALAFPLQIPILFGYIASISAIGSASPSTFVKVLAYLPPTAPFAMSVLVALGSVAWWQFVASALLSVASTIGVAVVAAAIYRRAILLTGRRVRLREILAV